MAKSNRIGFFKFFKFFFKIKQKYMSYATTLIVKLHKVVNKEQIFWFENYVMESFLVLKTRRKSLLEAVKT